MPPTPSITLTTALVLNALAGGLRYGFEIIDQTGLPSGTVYPILRRLEAARLVRSSWEAESRATAEGRPPRRNYEVTGAGKAWLATARARFPALGRGAVNRPPHPRPA